MRPCRGVLAFAARDAWLKRMIVVADNAGRGNAGEAAVVAGLTVYAPATLTDLLGWLRAGLASAPIAETMAYVAQ